MTLRFINSRNKYVLVPERILDIDQNRIMEGKALGIKDGCIAHLLSGAEVSAWAEKEGAEILRLPGLTLMPGLVDCHVHFALDSIDFNRSLARWAEQESLGRQVEALSGDFLRNGVLAVRDGGDKQGVGLEARKRAHGGLIVRAAGWAVRRNGYYGSFLGPGADTVQEAKEQIKELVQLGVDQIKIIVSGIVSFSHYGKVGPVPFSLAELTEIVDECHYRGRKVMAHASSDEGVERAVRAGVDSIEHGYFLRDQSLALMEERGTAWVPTLIPVAVQARDPYCQAHEKEGLDVIERTYVRHMKQIQKAASRGILLGIGTDAGAIGAAHGFSFQEELALFQRAGLSNREVLRAAILGGAAITGLDPGWGKLQSGCPAAFIAVKGNPWEDLSVMKQMERIVLPL